MKKKLIYEGCKTCIVQSNCTSICNAFIKSIKPKYNTIFFTKFMTLELATEFCESLAYLKEMYEPFPDMCIEIYNGMSVPVKDLYSKKGD